MIVLESLFLKIAISSILLTILFYIIFILEIDNEKKIQVFFPLGGGAAICFVFLSNNFFESSISFFAFLLATFFLLILNKLNKRAYQFIFVSAFFYIGFLSCATICPEQNSYYICQFFPLLLSLVFVYFSKGMPQIIMERIIPLGIQISVISIYQLFFFILEKW